jgi:uroporphyrinogen-III decarboxylase
MTSRERLWAAYNREEPDRMPIWMLYPLPGSKSYVDVHTLQSYRRIVPYVNEKTDWLVFQGLKPPWFYSAATQIDAEVFEDGDWTVARDILRTPKGDLVQESRKRIQESSAARTKHYCETIDDLDKVMSIAYEPAVPDVAPFLEAQRKLGGQGFMMVATNVPIDILYKLVHPELLALWTLLERDAVIAFCKMIFERQYAFLKRALEAGAGPIFHVVGTELIAPPMCSPATFDELITPFAAPIFELIHKHGGKVHLHHHGYIKDLLPIIADMGADAIHPIEEPPVGDCWMGEAKRLVGDRICFIGSVQWDDFARLTEEEMEALVLRQMKDAGVGGGMILAPSCGPYATQLSEQHQRNVVRFIETGNRYGRYPPQL